MDPEIGQRRKELEEQVKIGLQEEKAGQIKAGRALKMIFEETLWPQEMSRPEYVYHTFGIFEKRAEQLIAFVTVRDSIQGSRLPENERQARALLQANEDDRQSVWERACKASGKKPPTSTTIEKIIRKDSQKEAALANDGGQEPTPEVVEEDSADPPTVNPVGVPRTPPKPKEDYYLYVLLTIRGVEDIGPVENHLREKWKADRTNVRGSDDHGFRFQCPGSEVPALMDFVSGLLDKKMWKVELELQKTEWWQMPVSGRLYDIPHLPNRGCESR